MPFFAYDQNNSGGDFYRDDEAGIGERVIVEAATAEEADERAKRIGLYFDCCGSRWSMTYSKGNREDLPDLTCWGRTGPAFVHYADGRIEKHEPKPVPDTTYQYRDWIGDLWSRTPGGYYEHTEYWDGAPGVRGLVTDYAGLQRHHGPLTPVTQ